MKKSILCSAIALFVLTTAAHADFSGTWSGKAKLQGTQTNCGILIQVNEGSEAFGFGSTDVNCPGNPFSLALKSYSKDDKGKLYDQEGNVVGKVTKTSFALADKNTAGAIVSLSIAVTEKNLNNGTVSISAGGGDITDDPTDQIRMRGKVERR